MKTTNDTIEIFTTLCWPPWIEIAHKEGHFRRSWVVRFQTPATFSESSLTALLEEAGRKATWAAFVGLYSDTLINASTLEIELTVIDELHVIVHMTSTQHKNAILDILLVATAEVLRCLNSIYRIDDLQGIPRDFWLLLRN
jgi:hypothetical protein